MHAFPKDDTPRTARWTWPVLPGTSREHASPHPTSQALIVLGGHSHPWFWTTVLHTESVLLLMLSASTSWLVLQFYPDLHPLDLTFGVNSLVTLIALSCNSGSTANDMLLDNLNKYVPGWNSSPAFSFLRAGWWAPFPLDPILKVRARKHLESWIGIVHRTVFFSINLPLFVSTGEVLTSGKAHLLDGDIKGLGCG